MSGLNIPFDSNVIVGSGEKDDAGVYRISDDLALVQTLDFITPVCDDPFEFGRIAACNSLSDVYAMGGKALTAMNIVAFPVNKFSLDVLSRILDGGLDVMKEAGVQLLGGHSIDDPELKYGLSVTGLVHPQKVLRNNSVKPGNSLVLTKGLGTGIIATAIKAGLADSVIVNGFIKSMGTLNKYAADIMLKYNVSACTDVTGFGLAGHLLEMIEGGELSVTIDSSSLPLLDGALENAAMGLIPGGLYRNKTYVGDRCVVADNVKREISDVVFDPQTSGGLLISLPRNEAVEMLKEMKQSGINSASIIGEAGMSGRNIITVV
jgi:selenide,water dikinase